MIVCNRNGMADQPQEKASFHELLKNLGIKAAGGVIFSSAIILYPLTERYFCFASTSAVENARRLLAALENAGSLRVRKSITGEEASVFLSQLSNLSPSFCDRRLMGSSVNGFG